MFYTLHILIVVYNLLLYMNFRSGIYDYLRLSKMSKTNIRKSRKGFQNYWFYRSINEQKPLGILYYLNYIYLISSVIYSIITLALGYIKILQPFFLVFSSLLCLIQILPNIFSSIYSCQARFGKPFVLLAWSNTPFLRRLYSSLLDMLGWAMTAVLIYLSYRYK